MANTGEQSDIPRWEPDELDACLRTFFATESPSPSTAINSSADPYATTSAAVAYTDLNNNNNNARLSPTSFIQSSTQESGPSYEAQQQQQQQDQNWARDEAVGNFGNAASNVSNSFRLQPPGSPWTPPS